MIDPLTRLIAGLMIYNILIILASFFKQEEPPLVPYISGITLILLFNLYLAGS